LYEPKRVDHDIWSIVPLMGSVLKAGAPRLSTMRLYPPHGRERLRSADASRPLADGPVRSACSLLGFAVDRASRCGRRRAGWRLACVSHLPERAAGIVGDEERPVLGDGECGGPAPHLRTLFARSPEA